jgi:ribosome-binding protein aMBF1 (putative translation factor)
MTTCDMCGRECEETVSWGEEFGVCEECDEKNNEGLVWDKGEYRPQEVVKAEQEDAYWARIDADYGREEFDKLMREAEADEKSNEEFWADEIAH